MNRFQATNIFKNQKESSGSKDQNVELLLKEDELCSFYENDHTRQDLPGD